MTEPWFVFSYVLLWIAVLVLAVLLLAMYREIGQLYMGTRGGASRDGPRVGTRLPSVEATDGAVDVSRGRHMVLFGLETCTICEELVPRLAELITAAPVPFAVHVLIGGRGSERPAWATGEALDMRWASPDTTVRLGIRVSPFALYVVDGLVESKGVVNRPSDVMWMAGAQSEGGA